MDMAALVMRIAAEFGREASSEALRRAVELRRLGPIEESNRLIAAAIMLCHRR